MGTEPVSLKDKFERLPPGDYATGIIARMNDYEFKVVRFRGDFVWHSHADTDETFIVMDGVMIMSFRDRSVEVHPGEMIVVPKGVEHKPSSEEGYKALLIEPEGVPNTGDVQSDMTIAGIGWI